MNGKEPVYATAIPVPVQSTTQPAPTRTNSRFTLPPKSKSQRKAVTNEQLDQLRSQGFTTGLAQSLCTTRTNFPLRIWIVDNSGSMQKSDGQLIVPTKNKKDVKFVQGTRWAELTACVNYHAQMAALLNAPTNFRLLNDPGAMVGPQQLGIAEHEHDDIATLQNEVHAVADVMRKAKPRGVTPLSQHVDEIRENVRVLAPDLTQAGQRVSIIIATDGLPTNEDGYGGQMESDRFVTSLRSLEGLPVWVVIRLCTDEDDVVDFYNSLDEQLELSIEVLDDFVGEAKEVYAKNPWLNYALPLHRCRELGFHDPVFDMLDERALTKGELREFCTFLFGMDDFDGVPDPVVDWDGFLKSVDGLLKREGYQWNPMKKKCTPWLDTKALDKMYGDGSSCTIM